MDNKTKRQIIAITGVIVVSLGLIALVYGILNNNTMWEFAGFIAIIVSYGFTIVVKKLQEKERKEKEKAALSVAGSGSEVK